MAGNNDLRQEVALLLMSQQVFTKRLPTTDNLAAREYLVDVRQLPAGQYSYRFVVNGQPEASHHLVIQL